MASFNESHSVSYQCVNKPREKRAAMSYNDLTHFNASGEAHMVDVGSKNVTVREGVAEGRIYMQPETLKR